MGQFQNPAMEGAPSVRETNLSSGQIDGARQDWVRRGLDPARFDAAMGAQTPAKSAMNIEPPAPRAPDAPLTERDFVGGPDLSAEQAAEVAQLLQRQGRSEEDIRRALQADGYQVSEIDLLSPEEVAHDAEWNMNPHSPDEYRGVQYAQVLGAEKVKQFDRAELAAWDQGARELVAGIGMEAGQGRAFIERAISVQQQVSVMSNAGREQWIAAQQAALLKQAGSPERVAEWKQQAKLALSRAGQSAVHDELLSGFALADPMLVRTLANKGKAIAGWEASRPKKG